MATITGTNGNDQGVLGAVQPRLLGIPNPLDLSDDLLLGLGGNDEINGFFGNDTLSGGTGIDTMKGGHGNDTYIVDNAADLTLEDAGQGTDTVIADFNAVSYALSNNIENLTLRGAITQGIGNTLNNVIRANELTSVNNLLDGGAGRDTLIGGFGNDTYIVDNIGDVVVEDLNKGTDLIRSSVNYTLSANVENGELLGTAIALTGNSLGNLLIGNNAANQLNGGAGVDTMRGGLGHDTYFVNIVGDQVIELAGQGTDRVVSSAFAYTLAANVENLELAPNFAIRGVGNTLNNRVTGNQRDNFLDGGVGSDTLVGGVGNDTYVVDNAGDVVTELANQGVDIIQTNLSSFSLLGLINVENLTFTGSGNNTGFGNDQNNTFRGAIGNDSFSGFGGQDTLFGFEGNDALDGGSGNDFVDGGNLNDTLFGGRGNDVLLGGAGNDRLTGVSSSGPNRGRGELDTLTGGAGADTFFFAAQGEQFYNDGTIGNGISDFGLITDFSVAAGDRINLLAGQQYILGDAIQLGTGLQGTSISMVFADQANEVIGVVQGVNLGSGVFSSTNNTNAAFVFS